MARRKNYKKTKRRGAKKSSLISTASLVKIIVALLILLGLFILMLDVQIRHQFEGKRWSLPAKVYARPLELYVGAPIKLIDLKIELKGLGYQFVRDAQRPGQAAFSSSRAIIATRGFNFTDESEQARRLIISFGSDGITNLTDIHGKAITLLRLEPVLIGGIYPLNNEDRDLIQLKDTPVALTEALIAIEDHAFYEHHGISVKGITRAMLVNLKAGAFVQGGSTITQQLIKNFYLTSDRTLVRKLLEIPMAILLELHYSKADILQAYLNEVYLGQDGSRAIHGFGQGARYYFAQPLQELQLHQLALLAGLVKGPSYYDPRRHPERAKQRRDLVLRVLLDDNKISEQAYKKATSKPLNVVKKGALLKEAYPAYLDLVKRQLRRDYRDEDLRSEGLRVFTSLDPIVQAEAEQSLNKTLNQLRQKYGNTISSLQASMVVTDPQTGEVLAVIGDKNTRYKGFNRALDTERPIGSLIKPAVYLTGLENGYTLSSLLDDSPYTLKQTNGDVWAPQNFDKKSHENVTLIDALSHSYNIPTVRLGMSLGLDKVIETIERLGVNRPMKAYPSMLLGAQGMTPIEVATMYQTIANNGFQMPLRAIRTVTDSFGSPLSSYPFQLEQTISADEMYLLQRALKEVTRNGTARSIYWSLPETLELAGKTGTSNQQRDSWFAGFSANRLGVVWLGKDNNEPLPFTGSGGALRVWTKFMATQQLDSFEPPVPSNIELAWIDKTNGSLSAARCENVEQLPYIKGTTPTIKASCIETPQPDTTSDPIDMIKSWFD